ncbi:MAG: DUF488 domain-containing protein [Leucobacter sp.]
MDVRIKRVYEPAERQDGVRVLVDRLWPRGISKEDAALDQWSKDVAPSADLRKSWHAEHDPHSSPHFHAFAEAYREELQRDPASSALDDLIELARSSSRLTLLYGAKDTEVNHAVVLRDALLERAE